MLAGHGQGRGLAGDRDKLFKRRARELADVEPGERAVGERDELEPEAVRPARVTGDIAVALERREQARRGAGVDADPPGELGDAEVGVARGELIEQRERTRDGADGTSGWRGHVRGRVSGARPGRGSSAGPCGRCHR